MVEESKQAPAGNSKEELKLSEMLILASMWMLFGFMLWFFLSAFHGAPARIASECSRLRSSPSPLAARDAARGGGVYPDAQALDRARDFAAAAAPRPSWPIR